MSRVTNAPASRARRKKVLKMAKGYVGSRSKLYKTAKETVNKGLSYAYRDRRNKKRLIRRLWTVRINAALRMRGLSYSRFISLLKKANVMLDRKILSDLAVHESAVLDRIVELVQGS